MKRLMTLVAALVAACSASPSVDAGPPGNTGGGGGGAPLDAGSSDASSAREWRFTASVDGGTYVAGALVLEIPPGAVTQDTELTVRETADGLPGHELLSARYVFEPDGLQFVQDVAVTVTLSDPDGAGTLWWSVDGSDELEAVGLATDGIAEGFVRHFSTGAVSKKRQCIEPDGPGRAECQCEASDDAGGLLSQQGPDAGCGEWPAANSPYTGRDGDPCTGYAMRDLTRLRCACQTVSGVREYLCPQPFDTIPLQRCEADGGLDSYVDRGSDGASCGGFRTNGMRASGRLTDCAEEIYDNQPRRLSGRLSGCTPTTPAVPSGYALCDGSEAQRNRISQACAELLAAPGAGRTACRNADGTPLSLNESAWLGSRGGAFVENELFSGPGNFTQLEVPNASKDDCRGMSGRPGYPNLVQVVSDDGVGPIVVRVGDVKPLTRSGVSKGRADIHNCYLDAMDRAGAECARSPVPDSHRAFCQTLGSDGGRGIVADRMGSLGFSPGPFCGPPVKSDGGERQRYVAVECGPGITAFRCAD